MSGKYLLAVFLALQVSMSLCELEVPQPDQELVDKYEAMKGVFYKRLLNAYNKIQTAVAPLADSLGEGRSQAAKDYVEDLQTKPQFQAVVKVATGLASEAAPLVDKARMAGLGVYGKYLRPHVGTYLDDAITNIKVYLDQYLPAE
ncbi:apolipoprotein A-II [Osmerus mordax]|uniref:apolipoprotein A-II n=1 Tax=Osmerus mordax TaxID=8014 RepID=UPI003510CBDC